MVSLAFSMKVFSRNKKKLNPGAQQARDHRFIDKVTRGEISAFIPPLRNQDAKRPTIPLTGTISRFQTSLSPLSSTTNVVS